MHHRTSGTVAALIAALTASLTTAAATAQDIPTDGYSALPITLEAITTGGAVLPGVGELGWDDFAGKTVVLEFWGTWCGPCVAQIPHLNTLAEALEPRGDIAFLSVTFESPDEIAAFMERTPLRATVGYDTDRSMVESFNVRGWPTTFIVRNGEIIARTHPDALTEEVLIAFAEGRRPPRLGDDSGDFITSIDGERYLPIGRRDVGRVRAGLDPYSLLPGVVPDVQVIVRDAGENAGMLTIGPGKPPMTALGMPVTGVVSSLWDAEPWQIELGEGVDNARKDVIVRAPLERAEEVRALVAAALGVTVTREPREVGELVVRAAEGGVRLPAGDGIASGYRTHVRPVGDEVAYGMSGSNVPIAQLVQHIGNWLGMPVEAEGDGLDGTYEIDAEFAVSDEAKLLEQLSEMGLVVERRTREAEVLVVRPVAAAAAEGDGRADASP